MKSSPVETERLFIALVPDKTGRQNIGQIIQSLSLPDSCRVIPLSNIHLTLVFIGSFPVQRREELVGRLASVEADAFELVFDRLCFRKRQKMLWLEGAVSEPLSSLVGQLQSCVDPNALPERLFRPHITLARKLFHFKKDKYTIEPYRWWINNFSLVRSKTYASGAEYEVLETFSLDESSAG